MSERAILGIAGSLRAASYNRAALKTAQTLVPRGWRLETFDLDGIPGFSQDEERRPPPPVVELKKRIRAAEAILFATPEYNYSIPGVLKNAIDWASRPYGDSAWQGKPVAMFGASTSLLGTVRAQLHLRQVCLYLNMPAVNAPEVFIAKADEKFDANGTLTDPTARDLLTSLLQNLTAWVERLSLDRVPVPAGS